MFTIIRHVSTARDTVRRYTTHTDVIAGTVAAHRAYILLHTSRSPRTFPSRVLSPVQLALRRHALKWNALVNFSWNPLVPVLQGRNDLSAEDNFEADSEVYDATVFADGHLPLHLASVSLHNIDSIANVIEDHLKSPEAVSEQQGAAADVHLLVCTHAARDCRCGERGPILVDALNEEIRRRKVSVEMPPVTVGEVGHVGGHQYAANLLIFPHGDWLGHIQPEDAPGVLDAILDAPYIPHDNVRRPPLYGSHWRGRMGLSKEQQIQLFHRHAL
ncbi:hypothetical protein DENSPDRAFT_778607 [Dentipellis sp. KUC8613]|nr:hypothetical protein DENSPDRAFT_778607 [Dentipellis sp. KUC8613]